MYNLKLEVFESDKSIDPIQFYAYKVTPKEQASSVQQFMRSVAGKISYRTKVRAFTDDKKIYTIEKIANLNIDETFEIAYEKDEYLDVLSNKNLYADVVDFFIKENLRQVKFAENYFKYKVSSSAITSAYISEIKKTLSSDDKQFRLRREYNYIIKISDEKKVQLWLNVSSVFETRKTIYDLIMEQKNVEGWKVVNNWDDIAGCGVIKSIGPETVIDPLPDFIPLKQYYCGKIHECKTKKCPDDTPVVRLKINNGKKLYYYPQALKPVVTLEFISKNCPSFSKQIEKYTKLDMKSRFIIAKEFLLDIGCVEKLNCFKFVAEYVSSDKIGFSVKRFSCPQIECGNKKSIAYNKQSFVFANGFYKQPDNPVKFAYFYPQGKVCLMRSFAVALTDFLQKGSLFGNTSYLIPRLMNSELRAVCNEEYETGDPINYKKLVRSVSEKKSFDVAIVLVPTEEDVSNPYSTFKTAWAEKNIPSQMISEKTAKLFEDKNANAIWLMHNIALGIFAKSGGIPWIVDDIPGNIDCFVGIDVATLEKGIHYPTCATVFDKNGRPINFYKPKKAQKGEKINASILQEIFDEVILGYEESTGSRIKNLVIHRDGFSNEDAEWYEDYFKKKEIDYSVIEVKKFVSSKMLREQNGEILNPLCGDSLVNNSEAFVIMTDVKDGKASPRPLHIKRQIGNLPMDSVVQQILALSCMHFGATKKSRLPVTTYYADKICKNIDYVPEGKFGNRLFFL